MVGWMHITDIHFVSPREKLTKILFSSRDTDGAHPQLSEMRALIVEDEILVAWHLESILQDLSLQVCDMVSTGQKAIEKSANTDVDIIFMDINLAGSMDGIEAAKKILERRQVPIIFVTAYSSDEKTVSKIISIFGPSIIIGKPATAQDVRSALVSLNVHRS